MSITNNESVLDSRVTYDLLRCSKWPNSLSYLNSQLFFERTRRTGFEVWFSGDKCKYSLSSQLVCSSDDSSFRDTAVHDQSALDFGGTDSVTGYVDNIVDPTFDPVVAFVVSRDSVTIVEVSGVGFEVGFNVPGMITVDGSSERWPRLFADNDTFNIVSFQKLACRWVQNADIVTQEGEGSGSGFGGSGTRDRCDTDRTSLGHPVSINDGTLAPSDIVVVPVPSLGVDRFADTSNHSQAGEVVLLNIGFSKTSQKSDSL
jgi:hypothetical protein